MTVAATTIVDIGDLRRAGHAHAFACAQAGMALLDAQGHVLDVNAAMCRSLGYERAELLARGLGETLTSGALRLVEVPCDDGQPRCLVAVLYPGDQRDEIERDLREQVARLSDLALEDPLTGLGDRRRLQTELRRELARSHRYGRSFAVLLLNIDGFAKVNSAIGHDGGDRVLRCAGQALAAMCRESDLPARIGGDEFGLLLPQTDRDGARACAKRVSKLLSRQQPKLTASFGIACWPADGDSGESLLDHAAVALEATRGQRRPRSRPRPSPDQRRAAAHTPAQPHPATAARAPATRG